MRVVAAQAVAARVLLLLPSVALVSLLLKVCPALVMVCLSLVVMVFYL